MCLTQGPQRSDACEVRTRGPSSQLGGGEVWCPGSECFVDIKLLIFYRGERRSMPKNLFTVSEVGHHWPAYQGNTI